MWERLKILGFLQVSIFHPCWLISENYFSSEFYLTSLRHSLCSSCVGLLFIRGQAPCPECNQNLKKSAFREQMFDDPLVDREGLALYYFGLVDLS